MSEIRKGTKGSKQEGGGSYSGGDGGRVSYPKNQGTSDDKTSKSSVNTGRKGVNLETGK